MPRTKGIAPFAAIGIVGLLAAVAVFTRLPQNGAVKGSLLNGSQSSMAATDACAVSAVGLKCRCVVRAEDECMDLGGTFYARVSGGIDACEEACSGQ